MSKPNKELDSSNISIIANNKTAKNANILIQPPKAIVAKTQDQNLNDKLIVYNIRGSFRNNEIITDNTDIDSIITTRYHSKGNTPSAIISSITTDKIILSNIDGDLLENKFSNDYSDLNIGWIRDISKHPTQANVISYTEVNQQGLLTIYNIGNSQGGTSLPINDENDEISLYHSNNNLLHTNKFKEIKYNPPTAIIISNDSQNNNITIYNIEENSNNKLIKSTNHKFSVSSTSLAANHTDYQNYKYLITSSNNQISNNILLETEELYTVINNKNYNTPQATLVSITSSSIDVYNIKYNNFLRN